MARRRHYDRIDEMVAAVMAKCEQRMREAAYSFVGLPQTAENLNDFHNTMQQIRDQAEMEAAWLGIRYIVHNLLPTGSVGEDQA